MSKYDETNTEVNETGLDKDSMVGVLMTLGVGAVGGFAVTGGKAIVKGIGKGINWIKDKKENGKYEKEVRKEQNEELKERIRKKREEEAEKK